MLHDDGDDNGDDNDDNDDWISAEELLDALIIKSLVNAAVLDMLPLRSLTCSRNDSHVRRPSTTLFLSL
jgi:hypothetical protein